MLAPRAARWVEERSRPGENAVNESAALSPGLPLSSTLRRPSGRRASMVLFFVASSKLRVFVLNS